MFAAACCNMLVVSVSYSTSKFLIYSANLQALSSSTYLLATTQTGKEQGVWLWKKGQGHLTYHYRPRSRHKAHHHPFLVVSPMSSSHNATSHAFHCLSHRPPPHPQITHHGHPLHASLLLPSFLHNLCSDHRRHTTLFSGSTHTSLLLAFQQCYSFTLYDYIERRNTTVWFTYSCISKTVCRPIAHGQQRRTQKVKSCCC